MFAPGFTPFIISNEEMEYSGLLIKGVSETIRNEAKEQKRGFLGMLLGTLGASLLGNLLTNKRTIRTGEHVTNFEIQNCYENRIKFKGVYSRNNFSKIKEEEYIKNLDEYESIGTHWIALLVNPKNVACFDSFGVEYITKEIIKLIGNKDMITNIYKLQAYDSIMCEYSVLDLEISS